MNYKKISPSVFASAKKRISAIVSVRGRAEFPKKVKTVCAFPFISSVAVNGAFEDVLALSLLPSVSTISSVEEFSLDNNVAEGKGASVFFEDVAESVSSRFSVAVLDSGVNYHLDLSSFRNRVITRVSFSESALSDENGHGTMIAGLVGGNGLVSGGRFRGISPGSNVVSVKCMRKDGKGDSVDILKGMQWIYDNARRYSIKVVAMAFGAPYQGAFDPLVRGVEALYKKGLIVVTASGNDPADGVKSPGVSPYALTVGAYDSLSKTYARASFSAKDELLKKPEFLLPGVNVCAPSISGEYGVYSGTSVSCGVGAGIVAALCEKVQNPTFMRLKALLKSASHGEKDYERYLMID